VSCALKLSEMIRPAGSSAAELILKPVERRVMEWLNSMLVLPILRSVFIAATLVLILKDIAFLRESSSGYFCTVSADPAK
jgi:hypothetical protein